MSGNTTVYPEFFNELEKNLGAVDYITRDLALDQLLQIIGEPDEQMREDAAITLADFLHGVQVNGSGRDLERAEAVAERVNKRPLPAVMAHTFGGDYLNEAVEGFFAALREHRAERAAQAFSPYRTPADIYFANMGE